VSEDDRDDKKPSLRPSAAPSNKKKKKKDKEEVQRELRELTKGEERPPFDLKKLYLRGGAVVVLVWIIAFVVPASFWWVKIVAAVVTVAAAGAAIWVKRYLDKTQAIGALLKGADTEEGRKEALARLESDFKKDDTTAVIAKAQLQMQEDPRAALATLEGVNLDKVMAPIAAQVRAMRAMIHLTIGEVQEARALADKLDLGKQQEPKTRAMFATVASEAWARTGQAKKAVDTLELFNPEDDELAELRAQMWRARAFAYAGSNDMKGASRALKKLAEMNPHLLGMFVGQKKIHPLLEREAKQMVMRLGIVPRKMVRQRV
jgi:tetratricopeptide (TPR) repeat protein